MESSSNSASRELNVYESSTVSPSVLSSSSELNCQVGDWTLGIRAMRFTSNGKYISGYVDSTQELMQVLENYRTITATGFSNAQSLTSTLKPVEETQLRSRFLSRASKPRLFWVMNAGEPKIPGDGVPFVSIGKNTELPCVRYGGKRKQNEQHTGLPLGDMIPGDYRQKSGCDAKITIRRVVRFPDYAHVESPICKGVGQARRSRKIILDELGSKIAAGVAKSSDRYFFLLPTPLAHSGHEVSAIELGPCIAQPVSEGILAQLSSGITSIADIQEHCRSVANSVLGPEANIAINNSSYYPSEYDIFRHVYWLYKAGQVIDQEATNVSTGPLDSFTQTMSTPPPSKDDKVPVTSSADGITNVYSIVMDEGSVGDSGLEHLGDDINTCDAGLDSIDTTLAVMNTTPTMTATNLSQLVRKAAQFTRSTQQLPSTKTTSLLVEDDTPVAQAQREVRDMLKIIENQTHGCHNEIALNGLRRQLTDLCCQFSMHLAGVPSAQFEAPPTKKLRL